MNINCQKEDLLYAVQIIGKAISAKNTMPILNGILIIAEENFITLRATDLDIASSAMLRLTWQKPASW